MRATSCSTAGPISSYHQERSIECSILLCYDYEKMQFLSFCQDLWFILIPYQFVCVCSCLAIFKCLGQLNLHVQAHNDFTTRCLMGVFLYYLTLVEYGSCPKLGHSNEFQKQLIIEHCISITPGSATYDPTQTRVI